MFSGNLRASILATLTADPDVERSETDFARACGVTRKAAREALDRLAFCGLLTREADENRTRVVLAPDARAA